MNRTGIEYVDLTWNPVVGCTNDCTNDWGNHYCCARRCTRRFGDRTCKQHPTLEQSIEHGLNVSHSMCWNFFPHLHEERLEEPVRRKKAATILCGNVCDLWDPHVPQEWRDRIWEVMWRTLGHNYLVLTKQPRRITRRDINSMTARDGFLYGVSITTQAEVWRAERVPVMADLLPFVSAEPLLGAFDLRPFLPLPWVIVGAQTGPGAKPPEEGWVREIIAACRETGTPVFCKGNLRRLPGMELLPQEWPQELREASDD